MIQEQPQHRRGFHRPGRTRVQRDQALPVRRQLRALLNNPTPSPAEQLRLQELTGTRSLKAALAAANRMLAAPAESQDAAADQRPDSTVQETAARKTALTETGLSERASSPTPVGKVRNPGRRAT